MNYEQDHSHVHCWDKKDGQKGHTKHLQCCICLKANDNLSVEKVGVYEQIRDADIKETIDTLKRLNMWLSLNIGGLSLVEFKRIRKQIEQLEIAIQIKKDNK